MRENEKNKTKTVRQFRITWASISRVVWGTCVVLLILAMVLTAGTAVVSLFMPSQSTTQNIDPAILQQLQEQMNQSQTPELTVNPT